MENLTGIKSVKKIISPISLILWCEIEFCAGTSNLETGGSYPHEREDLFTKPEVPSSRLISEFPLDLIEAP